MTTLEAIFIFALLFKTGTELLLEFLNRSQVRKYSDGLPQALEGVMDDETFAKSNKYTLAKSKFGSWEMLFDAAVLAVVILAGVLPALFQWWTGFAGESNLSSALFLIFVMVLFSVPGIPFEYYSQFKLEERFGFNRSTVKLWIMDKVKGSLVGFVIGFPLLWLLINLVGWLGDYWWIYGFGIMFVFQIVMMVLYPMVIMPLFNKLSPLEEGELRDRLMALSDRTGFKAQTIQVIDGSKRSSHSNAYFTGFGKFRRIVLYDTLIEQLGHEELEAVLAHEIGHYKKGHIPKMIASSAVMMFLGFFAVDYLASSEWFFEGFGFESANLGIAFLLFSMIGGLFTFWLSPIFNKLSRKHEYEADDFAKNAVGSSAPLSRALRGLSEKNLSNLTPHPAYSAFHYSHPTLIEREQAMAD
ncbi:M48 family metallopeptidase [Puniceicoccaceae bacterium K14]|nr:M48 family metallopeptidase [Puniceicoccaceae bacterium K14]